MSMYQLNPLLEMSTRQLMKKRKLYTPEQWRSMMDRLQKIGKNANAPVSGLHSADEYGRRMIAGQKLRGQKLAKANGRHLITVGTNSSIANGSNRMAMPNEKPIDLVTYSINPFRNAKQQGEEVKWGLKGYESRKKNAVELAKKRALENFKSSIGDPNDFTTGRNLFYKEDWLGKETQKQLGYIKDSRKDAPTRREIRKRLLRPTQQHSAPLTTGETLAHEMDEYSQHLKLMRKYGLDANAAHEVSGTHGGLFGMKRLKATQSSNSSHNPGVLDREVKRIHRLNTLYGRDAVRPSVRDARQFAMNKEKHVLGDLDTKNYIHNATSSDKVKAATQGASAAKEALELKNQLKQYGYHKMTKQQLDAEYNKLLGSTYERAKINQVLQKRGIPRYIKDPDYVPGEEVGRFTIKGSSSFLSQHPDMMVNPEARPIIAHIKNDLSNRRTAIGDYLDMLERQAGK